MQLVKYDNPEVDISCKGKHSLTVLGQEKISDFSGDTSSGLGFRDYKDAYTNSCLIDVRRFQDKNRPRDKIQWNHQEQIFLIKCLKMIIKNIFNNN